jgi:transposase-like protein
VKPDKAAGLKDAEKKKAILKGVKESGDSVKATLERLGLGQSTYYRWLKQYKEKGLDGLTTGQGVPDKVWKRFSTLKREARGPSQFDKKVKVEGKGDMKSDKEQEKRRELLFKRFDEGPSRPAGKKEEKPEPAKAPEGPPLPSYTGPPEDPMDKMLQYAVGAFALVIAILVIASMSNSNNFYFKQKDEMIQMWRGRFAPMGKVQVASFSDPKILEGLPDKDSYTKKEAYSVLCDYFIDQADALLSASDTPDLKGAKTHLRQASKYAVSDAARGAIKERLRTIERVRDNFQAYVEEPEEG